jgi:exosortase/archaeosortase family protein
MYKPPVAIGTAVLGVSVAKLPYTGFSTVAYVLFAIALLITGLLLARMGRGQSGTPERRERVGRVLLTVTVAGAGLLLLLFASWWRGVETWTAAHSIALVSSQAITPIFHTGIVIMRDGQTSASAFALTSQCSVAQILGAMLIGGAPLLLVRRLSVVRVGTALMMASVVLVAANVIRLTAIGVAVQAWGRDGFSLSHTYLGSLVTFVGTCLAGMTFALVLLARRRQEMPTPTSA